MNGTLLTRALHAALVAIGLLLVLAATASAVPARPSIVSLLAPAHGTAFAFGGAGHLLSTKSAVDGRATVEIVSADGRYEKTTVLPTSNPLIVQLRGTIVLRAFRPTVPKRPSTELTAISGPLNGSITEHGTLTTSSGVTSLPANSGFEGAPALNGAGRALGIITISHGRLIVLPVKGLKAEPTVTSHGGVSLLPLLAIFCAFGVGVGLVRIVVRSRVERSLDKSRRVPSATGTRPRRPVRSRSQGGDTSEADTGVHVVLRPREPGARPPEEPQVPAALPPDVRLHRRNQSGGSPPTSDRQAPGRRPPA